MQMQMSKSRQLSKSRLASRRGSNSRTSALPVPPPGPVRTCVGCRRQGTPKDLVRMVLGSEGEVAFDLAGGAVGRGAWVHPIHACLSKAKKATSRSLKLESASSERGTNAESADALVVKLARAAARRGVGLIGAAHRARHLALGSDASKAAFDEGRARLVILATDARAAKRESWLEAAATRGLLAAWSSKAELGAIVGRDELAVLVVTDEGLAQSLRRVMAMTIPLASQLANAARDSARTTGSQGRQDSEDG